MMKSVFPLLLCYVFTASQTFALSGGPIFGNGTVDPTGIYSGVLQGNEEFDGSSSTDNPPTIPGDPNPTPDPTAPVGTPSNALGIFSLTVPTTELGSGTFILFADGTIFSGTIDASVDIDTGVLKGLIQGRYDFNLEVIVNNAVQSIPITAQARGNINARVTASNRLAANSLARLIGTASLGVDFGNVDGTTLEPIIFRTITFNVTGYKQANASS